MQHGGAPTTPATPRTRAVAAGRRDVWVSGLDASADSLAAMVREGLLVAVAGGLHLAADVAGERTARVGALLALGPGHLPPGGVVTARAGLWAHGLVAGCGPIDVAVRPPRRAEVRGGPVPVRWREVDVPREHRTPLVGPAAPAPAPLRRALPQRAVPQPAVPQLAVPHPAVPQLAVPERAAADVLRWAPPAEAVEVLLEARRAGLDPAAVARCVERLAGRSFSRRAREALSAAQRLATLTGTA